MNSYLNKILLIATLLGFVIHASSQNSSRYITDRNYNSYIDYLINSGQLTIDHPLNQPYKSTQIKQMLDSNNHSSLHKSFSGYLKKLQPSNGENGDLLISTEGGATGSLNNNSLGSNYNSIIGGSYLFKNLSFVYTYEVNSELVDDPAIAGSIGKLQTKVIGRSPTAYIMYSNKYLDIFYGRLHKNFGHINTWGFLLSDNPQPYDHFSFSFHNKIVKYSFICTRLDDRYAFDIRDVDGIPEYKWYKRYISLHRLEFNFSHKVNIALTESILYAGENQTMIAGYINPANIFYLSKMSDRNGLEEKDANAMFGFEFLVRPVKGLSIYSHLLIDDMDFTKELREKYPDRLGIVSRVNYAFPQSPIQISTEYTRISNWTYNSFYTYGNYTFFDRSLGHPQHGVEQARITMDWFRFRHTIISASGVYNRKREQDLESPFLHTITAFPAGISENIIGGSTRFVYSPRHWISCILESGFYLIENYQHISRNNKNYFNINLSLRLRGMFSFPSKE